MILNLGQNKVKRSSKVALLVVLFALLAVNSEIRSHGMRLDATVQVVRIASATEEKGFAGAGDLATQKG